MWSSKSLSVLWRQRWFRRVCLAAAGLYFLVYQVAIQDLAFHDRLADARFLLVDEPLRVMLQQRGPFQFEPVALVELPFITWTLAPLNMLVGLILAILVGLNAGYAWAAVSRPRICRAR
ncbi:hypothetical protein H0Z60_20980, partial [Ectothiorhodospiraceae bacterium WFHF3C12]|nr:hypothetical protein [Ectothiorhodospiraceae bacterium WFHF3C12]